MPELRVHDPFCTANDDDPCDPSMENPCCRDANILMKYSGTKLNGQVFWVSESCLGKGSKVFSPGDKSCCADVDGNGCAE